MGKRTILAQLGSIKDFSNEYKGNFVGDLSGGITTAVVALPLALAFAIASGVDAKYGLYTAIVTGVVAAIFGGSKVQITGPTGGMAAVLVALTAQFGYDQVVILALIAGLFQILAGFFKLGRFVKMLPFPLVAGFTMGIGVVIFGGQIDHALGLSVHHHETEFFDRLKETFQAAYSGGVNLFCVGIALGTIGVIALVSRISARIPAALIAVILASLIVSLFQWDVPKIHDIPKSLPVPRFPEFSWHMLRDLLRPAATIAALGSIESLLAAVVADNVLADGSKHNPNRELVGQGLANITASFFGGIPCTGAIARTAVNIKSGGRTRLAALIHSGILIVAMAFLAPLATRIPIAALAGVLMFTAVRMVEWREIGWLMTAPRTDIAVMAVTVLVTVFTDLVMAVEFGIVAAGIIFIKKMSEIAPVPISLDRTGESTALDHRQIRIFRVPGPLFWGDSHAVLEAMEECTEAKVVVLKMQYVSHIDASGIAMLREAKRSLDIRGIRFCLVNIPVRTLKDITQMGIIRELGEKNIFVSLEEALRAFRDEHKSFLSIPVHPSQVHQPV